MGVCLQIDRHWEGGWTSDIIMKYVFISDREIFMNVQVICDIIIAICYCQSLRFLLLCTMYLHGRHVDRQGTPI